MASQPVEDVYLLLKKLIFRPTMLVSWKKRGPLWTHLGTTDRGTAENGTLGRAPAMLWVWHSCWGLIVVGLQI